MQDLAGKIAFVTGGASGIGLGMVRAFLRAGMKIVIADINKERADRVAAGLARDGADILGLAIDVAKMDSWRAAKEATIEKYGGVDILCNNAGVGAAKERFENIPEDVWQWILGVNVIGVRNGVCAWLRHMKERQSPCHIVNTASVVGLFGNPLSAEYVATKYAVIGMSETLRMELVDFNVGVSVLCPGLVKTQLMQDRALNIRLSGYQPDKEQVPTLLSDQVALDPDKVGEAVLAGILARSFYILPQPEYAEVIDSKYERIRREYKKCPPTGEDITGLGRFELQWGKEN